MFVRLSRKELTGGKRGAGMIFQIWSQALVEK
jgi:hypothetical protein